MTTKTGFLALLALALSAPAAMAQGHDRHHARIDAPAVHDPGDGQGGIIARATERAQDEPGLTNELAPDSRQTATGGPAGGLPGFGGK